MTNTQGTTLAGQGINSGVSGQVQQTVSVPAGTYTFSIEDTYGDGICCSEGQGSYSIIVDGTPVLSGGQFATSQSGTFTIDSNGNVSIEGNFSNMIELPGNNAWLTGISGAADSWTDYYYVVPNNGVTAVRVRMTGGSGDADLFVKWDGSANWKCTSENGSNDELCAQAELSPIGNILFVSVYGYSAYSNASIKIVNFY